MQKDKQIGVCLTDEKVTHKFIDIKPIIIPQDQLDKLNAILEFHRTRNSIRSEESLNHHFLQNITRICSQCGKIAEYLVSYDVNGASLIERYYTKCLELKQSHNSNNIKRNEEIKSKMQVVDSVSAFTRMITEREQEQQRRNEF